ncbi:MAG TPA: hypothetical protein VHA35_01440 [Dongiaceae bacterium]|jgi:hypothetical protein|nr:hypothetical protein [Dongiaceae bacterium]
MPSIVKILLLVAIVWIVWRGFNRIVAAGQASRNPPQGRDHPGRPRPPQRPVEDMVKCPKCGAYVSAQGDHHCE